MTAREFMSECNLFVEFGKIKDIDFNNELYYEDIDDRVKIMDIDFEDNMVKLGTLVPFGCGDDCCGLNISGSSCNFLKSIFGEGTHS